MNWADLPANATWAQFYGVALLCGIGFTMSLFIGLLAFPTSADLQDATKLGVLLGSALSGLIGAALLRLAKPERASSLQTITTVASSMQVSDTINVAVLRREPGPLWQHFRQASRLLLA